MKGALIILAAGIAFCEGPVDYPIVYVRAPRAGDQNYTKWQEVKDPIRVEPGSDLMVLYPDGREQVLFAAGNGAVADPVVSFDGQWVYFSYYPDARPQALENQMRDAPRMGADIYKINVNDRRMLRLTRQDWDPAAAAANWSANPLRADPEGTYYTGYGIFNLAPCPLPGKVMFVSSRDSYLPNKGGTFPNLRLYIMDDDGRNVETIGHLNIGSALHPAVLMDGRVMFSSYESHAARDARMWGLWAIWPDGRKWEPLMSAFNFRTSFHFQTQLSDGRIAVVDYYNQNDFGLGTILAFPVEKPSGAPPFGEASPGSTTNPLIRAGLWFTKPGDPLHLTPRFKRYPFSPPGLESLTGFALSEDVASSRTPDGNGYEGKVTHPSGAPGNDVLLVWSPGPNNARWGNDGSPPPRPAPDGGLYLLRGGKSIDDSRQLVLIKNDSKYNELQPRALVPYSRIYGIPEPAALPYLPNDGSESPWLPPGTPFGIVGTSSFYKRNTSPGAGKDSFGGLDAFNSTEIDDNPLSDLSANWLYQGADAGKYSNPEIFAVRIVAQEGTAHRAFGPRNAAVGFRSHAGFEKLRILGEIPLRKEGSDGTPLLDPDGNPDTSFAVKIPADTPFTFQTLDKDGMVLNMAQTWHQVRPGEVRVDCGGCHAHSQVGTDFSKTAAARADYVPRSLVNKVPLLTKDAAGNTVVKEANSRMVDVEYYRDIKPILLRSCVPCHGRARAEAQLVLDDTAPIDGFERNWFRLADDRTAQYGIKPLIKLPDDDGFVQFAWNYPNASRYIRLFQSRRSLLMWKMVGRRLDGWTNEDHPTEVVPGDLTTFPRGADPGDADIDYTGAIMPPPDSGLPPLSDDEKMTIARWIDLGCPISSGDPQLRQNNFFADHIKPVLSLSLPRSGRNTEPLRMIRIGMYDANSGLDARSLSVTANFAVNGKAEGGELAGDFAQTGDHIWTLNLTTPITSLRDGRIVVKVKDAAGNMSTVDRAFSVP